MYLKSFIFIALALCAGILGGLTVLASPTFASAPENISVPVGVHQTTPVVSASSDSSVGCQAEILTIMEQISRICETTGQNEVCYGNRQVEASSRNERVAFDFAHPGDHVSLNLVRSLQLSMLDVDKNLWGVAQLRLLLPDARALNDVELLLFGEVYVEDASEERLILPVQVITPSRVNLRNVPDTAGLVVTTIAPDQVLSAVGRSVTGDWLEVLDTQTGYQGWVYAELVDFVDGATPDQLHISDASRPYWRPMQAFVFESGQSGRCDQVSTDGLLIQTADGLTRITLLVNEVTLELLPGANGSRASALVQSSFANGMSISMIEGQAQATVAGTTYDMSQNTSLEVSFGLDGKPSGARVDASVTSDGGVPTVAHAGWVAEVTRIQQERASTRRNNNAANANNNAGRGNNNAGGNSNNSNAGRGNNNAGGNSNNSNAGRDNNNAGGNSGNNNNNAGGNSGNNNNNAGGNPPARPNRP